MRRGERPLALSRSQQDRPGIDWFRGDLEKPDTLKFPPFATLYCTADAILLANALPRLFNPSLRATCRLQFDQRDHQTGHGSRGRTGDDQKTRRRRAKDRRGMRTAQCRLDDIASHADLRRGSRHQYHAVVAPDPPIRLHAAGRRSAGAAATGACGGPGDRSHRRRRKPRCRQQDSIRCRARRRSPTGR